MTEEITIYHSPDADDAFMFYGLTCGAVKVPGYTIEHSLSDIETLNQRALRGELDVTAVSVHAYSKLHPHYDILDCGASMGEKNYGPRLITTNNKSLSSLRSIAVPGELTSATLAVKLFLHNENIDIPLEVLSFDQIQEAVQKQEVDGGVIIHEGQLTFEDSGLSLLCDLGQWWHAKTALPLPLGVNIVKRSLPEATKKAAAQALSESIRYSLSHREQALDYALTYGRGISREIADTFVGMYVNERTLSLGHEGREAIKRFLTEGSQLGFCNRVDQFTFVTPVAAHSAVERE